MAANSASNNNSGATTQKLNFNPSWMQQTAPNLIPRTLSMNNSSNSNPQNTIESSETCDPIFAKYSYGREDLLAMMGKNNQMKTPNGLEKCPFFLEKPQQPMLLLPFTETEMRLQQNINSSKAMSSFNRAQGGSGNSGNEPGSAGNEISGGWATAGTNRTSSLSYGSGNRKYQQQDKVVPNRWSALASTGNAGGAGTQNRPSWKTNTGNNGPAVPTGGLEQKSNTIRGGGGEKNAAVGSFERSDSSGGQIIAKKNQHEQWPQSGDTTALTENQRVEPTAHTENQSPETCDVQSSGKQNESGIQKKQILPNQKLSSTVTKQGENGNEQHKQQEHLSPLQQQQSVSPYSIPFSSSTDGCKTASGTASQQQLIQQTQPSQPTEKWQYLDPNGVQRGPFECQQMQAWFTSGYFTANLQVRRVGEPNYITLGELFRINGDQTPFINKVQSVSHQRPQQFQPPSNPDSTQNTLNLSPSSNILASTAAAAAAAGAHISPIMADVERIWATTPLDDVPKVPQSQPISTSSKGANITSNKTLITTPSSSIVNAAGTDAGGGFVHAAFSQHLKELEMEKILQTKEIQILEEQRKLREKEELLLRDEQDRMEKERQMQQLEAELKRKQDDLGRIAREKDHEFEQRCRQMAEYERKKRDELIALEQRIRTEHQQQQLRLEEEDRRRARELQDLLIREQERQRQLMESETKRKRDEEEARFRLALQETQHAKELAMEQAKRVEEEQRRRLIDEQQRQQQMALERARAERIRQQEVAAKAEAAAKAEQHRISSSVPKISPTDNIPFSQQPIGATNNNWQTVQKSQIATTPQQQHQHRSSPWQPIAPVQSQPIQLDIPLPVVSGIDPVLSTAATTTTKSQQQAVMEQQQRRGWQQMPIPKPTPIPPPIGRPTQGNVILAGKQQTNKGGTQQQKGGKKDQRKQQQSQFVEDKFTAWIIKRVREMNASVDAEVFANFIAQIDSPNEAEDYIIGYLGDKKEVKDFHREFLNKRIELRPRVQQPQKDDLSRPAAALGADADTTKSGSGSAVTSGGMALKGSGTGYTTTTVSNNPTGGGAAANKKKKQKEKKVLDPATLGFRSAPDPNRVNAGEIDSVAPVLGGNSNNRKR